MSDWTRRLEPLLRAQEEGVQFDIHDYSDRFLSQVSTMVHRPQPKSVRDAGHDPAIVNFHAVAAGQAAPEVCRMFLACLQLANMGNVSVIPPSLSKADPLPAVGRSKKAAKDILCVSHNAWSQETGFDLRLVREARRLLETENVF